MNKSSAVQLCLANIGLLDRGAAQLVVDQALAKAVSDTDDRGDDGKARIVEIKVSMVKLKSGMIEATLEAGLKLPIYRVNPTAANVHVDHVTKQNVLQFQPMSPENPAQEELQFNEDEQ